jgi:hypothetical protein
MFTGHNSRKTMRTMILQKNDDTQRRHPFAAVWWRSAVSLRRQRAVAMRQRRAVPYRRAAEARSLELYLRRLRYRRSDDTQMIPVKCRSHNVFTYC